MEEPDGLQSMGSKRVGHNLVMENVLMMGYMCPFQLWFSLGIFPVVELLDNMVVLF